MSGTTRREALAAAGAAAAATLLGCGGGSPTGPGSTLLRTLTDPDGDGLLTPGPGLPLRDRTELAPARRIAGGQPLATLAQLADLHVRDAQSPGRVAFLDRLGPRLGSAFRWHETLTTQVLAATIDAVNAARPDAVVVAGDLADTAQRNELEWATTLLAGGTARPDSGGRGYRGVQAASIADPLYYRPDVDAPRHPGLLQRAVRPVRSPGLTAPWHPVLGNHDILVAGEVAPSHATRAAATGTRLLVTPSSELLGQLRERAFTREQIDAFLREGLDGDALRVPADLTRTQPDAEAIVAVLRARADRHRRRAVALRGEAGRLDEAIDVGDAVHLVVLDVVRRDAGAGGLVTPATLAFLQDALARAGDRHVVVAVHQPLDATAGGDAVRDVLSADPRVVAVLAGHTHRNAVVPRRGAAGGYWEITTASIVDWPQQWRALRLVETRRGGVALETWMVDHTGRPNAEDDLAGIARDLAFLDPQGGRPARAAGPPSARNVRLHLPAREPRAPRRPATPRPLPPPAPPGRLGAGDTPA